MRPSDASQLSINRKRYMASKADAIDQQPERSQVCGPLRAGLPVVPRIETRKPTVCRVSCGFERPDSIELATHCCSMFITPHIPCAYLCLLLLALQSRDVGGGTLVDETPCLELGNGIAQVPRHAPHVSPSLNPPAAAPSLEAELRQGSWMRASRSRARVLPHAPGSSLHAAPLTAPCVPLPAPAPSAARRSPASHSS